MIKKLLMVAVVLLGVTAFFLSKSSTESPQGTDEKPSVSRGKPMTREKSTSSSEPVVVPTPVSTARVGKIEKDPFVPRDKAEEGLQRINNKLNEIFTNKESPQELVHYFEEEKLEPEMSQTSNEYTGTMMMIRTQKSIPGVRYFHAQYMGDDPEHTFLQHFSYEFRPSPNSMERATQSAEGTFKLSNKRIHRDGDFITYDIGEEGQYELSIEKADWESLKDDPYNAHSKEDVGTVITRIELKVHEQGENDHIEPEDHE